MAPASQRYRDERPRPSRLIRAGSSLLPLPHAPHLVPRPAYIHRAPRLRSILRRIIERSPAALILAQLEPRPLPLRHRVQGHDQYAGDRCVAPGYCARPQPQIPRWLDQWMDAERFDQLVQQARGRVVGALADAPRSTPASPPRRRTHATETIPARSTDRAFPADVRAFSASPISRIDFGYRSRYHLTCIDGNILELI